MNEQGLDKTHGAIAEAFRSLLAHDFGAATRALARAQAEHYGQKPWRAGAPLEDALGNRIVFREDVVGRYTVRGLEADGSHVRILLGDARIEPVTMFEARGPTAERARMVASKYSDANCLAEVRSGSSYIDDAAGAVCITYSHRPTLD